MQDLRKQQRKLSGEIQEAALRVLASEQKILAQFERILRKKFSAMKMRIHGDYHLGQVLYTGKDFFIIDFEGEPARSLSERRLKRSPLVDVTGMVRSFHYAAYSALFHHASLRPEDIPHLEPWVEPWYRCIGGVFLDSYLKTVGDAPIVPADREDMEALFHAFLLEKAVYELGYEINNRPDWVKIPVKGIQAIMKAPA
jgi:maltose alpha-D-glucosyltransferase/alpha-amylase